MILSGNLQAAGVDSFGKICHIILVIAEHTWAISSFGRALPWHGRGDRSESGMVHITTNQAQGLNKPQHQTVFPLVSHKIPSESTSTITIVGTIPGILPLWR